MSVPINDTFQVRIQGQLIDCIKAEAWLREVEKNAYSIFFCTLDKVKELINLKRAVEQTDNSALWVANSDGSYLNPGEVNYSAYKAYDLLYAETNDGDTFTIQNLGNVLTDDGSAKFNIYASLEDVYALTDIPRGSSVVVYSEGKSTVYVKITNKTTTTSEEDWSVAGSSGTGVSDYLNLTNRPSVYYFIKLINETDADAIARVMVSKEPKYGDILILRETDDGLENGLELSVTSYIYDSIKWRTLTGNYDPTKIILPDNLTLSGAWQNVGTIKRSDGVFNSKGMTLWEFIDTIFNGVATPTIKREPTVSVTAKKTGAFEIGSEVTQNYTISLVDGAYDCADEAEDMDAFISSYVLVYTGANSAPVTGDQPSYITDNMNDGNLVLSGNDGTIRLPIGYNKKFTLYATVTTNKYATNNKGETTTIKYNPSLKTTIVKDEQGRDTTITYTHKVESGSLSAYRMGAFYGASDYIYTEGGIASIIIRSLNRLNTPYPLVDTTKEFTVYARTQQLLVAVPEGCEPPELYNVTVNSPFDLTLLKASLSVRAADDTAANAGNYDVYAYTPSIPFRTTNTVRLTLKA